jgi:cytochrome c-type biogenesis protein CcmH
MNRVRALFTLLLLISFALPAQAQTAPLQFSDPVKQARYQGLLKELRCLVCQNQSLADSPSGLASDLRAKVYEQVAQGRSDDEAISYLVARYGDFVRYRPPLKPVTYALWLGPVILLIIGLTILGILVRRRSRAFGAELTDEERIQARDLLQSTRGK